jgi:hypothetical protein
MKQSKMAFGSLAVAVVFGSLSVLGISSVRAEEMPSQASDEGHPCAEYVKHCKSQNLTPGHGLWKCVAKEAKKSNNEVCMAKLKEGAKKMHEKKKHHHDSEQGSEKEAE